MVGAGEEGRVWICGREVGARGAGGGGRGVGGGAGGLGAEEGEFAGEAVDLLGRQSWLALRKRLGRSDWMVDGGVDGK